jgi:hypothetical protein
MRLKIMIGVAALALGPAVTSVPAFAFDAVPGYNSQGGVTALPQAERHSRSDEHYRRLYNRNLPPGGTTVP